MVEIFTVGGGEYIVNVLNAVAAWTGAGGYKSLIQVALVMGMVLAVIVVAFNQDWRAWLNWFLGATLIYMCLMVPRMDVHVTDRVNPSLAPATVANVPLGLALMASFTSQAGDYLTRSAELVFGLPDDLNYSKNGMIYGARLLESTRSLRISDPEFAANFDEHVRQCVFYDLLLGRYSMKELSESDDIWATIAPGSAARAQKFLTRQADDSVTASIITCREAYTALSGQWAGLIDEMTLVAGRQLYPRQTEALARAKLMADLPIAYQYLTGISRSASDIFRQVLTINAMNQAMHGFAGASGTGSIDVFAQTRADIQTERTYSSIAHNAMKWVPILNVVLTVVFYALFPVLFPLFLMPRTGPIALRGYVTGFFYLAAWGPLFVILHMILMFKGAGDVAAAGGSTGLSLATFAGMSDVNSDIGILAGYLVASIPFLAGGVARGALAISGQATSYLNPSQNAAEEAAREASTGNVSLGNSNIDNSTVFSRQFAQGNLVPNIAYGAAQTRGFSDSGTQTTSFPDGEFAAVPNSSYPFTPTLGQDFTGRLGTMASQSRTQSETYANLAQQSTSSALTRFSEIRNAYSQGQSSDTVSGVGTNDSIGTAFSEVDNASRTLQQQFGLSRRASDDITVSWFLNGDAGIGLKGERGPVQASAGLRGGRNQTWTDSDIGIASEDRGRIMGTLRQLSDSRNWSNTREGFLRETSSSSVSQVSTSSSGLSRSLTEAESYTREARRAEEMASRLENQASWYEANSAAGTLNLSQAYREWGMAEMEANRDYYGPVRFDDIEFQMSARGQQLQSRFVESYADRLQDDIEADLSLPDFAPVSRPGIGSAGQVRARGAVGSAGGPSMPNAPDRSDITDEVERVRQQGRGRIGTVRGYLDRQTQGATGASEEAADDVKEW
ncbi:MULTISPECIES: conjugal transfer protein TraG N-terminal domain-containing protein [Sphingomonadales]|uniref:Conjugal transfer mating pair stabilization protein TraG n=2 Tax=Sphingomonadales TaxID=204457 RepID=A0A239KW15_9SPHN|nr:MULTISPECIES: conjugal transfer protein TraG N-terminal domain-containing protein [Sphingomonadales]QSB45442.1 conjugal transfer protein TraG N-terminal domain-containing protein [Tsuneonella flava]SNT22567.1 conjugal transfer mating pair stabilization protein TraG [Sphingopyxis indica]